VAEDEFVALPFSFLGRRVIKGKERSATHPFFVQRA